MPKTQTGARERGDSAGVPAAPASDSAAEITHAATAKAPRKIAGIDLDRARGGTQTATGARVEPVVREIVAQLSSILAGSAAPRQLPPADDALARRKRELVRRAHRFTES